MFQLNVKSGYTFLGSTLSVPTIVSLAKKNRQTCVALTDVNGLFGVPEFLRLCQKETIKPVIGMEVLIQEDNGKTYPLILLAQDYFGYQQLTKLTALISKNQSSRSVFVKELMPFTYHLICIIPSVRSILMDLWNATQIPAIKEVLKTYLNQFQSFYVGIESYDEPIHHELISYLRSLPILDGIRIALQSVRYPELKDQQDYHIVQAIAQGTTLNNVQLAFLGDESYNRINYQFLPEEIELNKIIADKCQIEFPKPTLQLIDFPLPEGVLSRNDYLRALAYKGLEKRLATTKIPIDYRQRLSYELETIIEMGFSNYFLVVYDYVKYAKTHEILVGPGRGSAAGSLVAYVLGITNVDPLVHGLLFERFLNSQRITLPDIDIDFPDHQRNQIITYLREKYTNNHFAHVIAFSTFGAKSSLRDVGKALGLSLQDVDFLAKRFPSNVESLSEGFNQSKIFRELLESREVFRRVYETACRIEGLPRQTTLHAAGIVLSKLPLAEIIPVYEQEPGINATQFSMDYLEQYGLLKMDILGLKNLTIIADCLNVIKNRLGKLINLSEISMEDESVYSLIRNGYTSGVFQLETAGMVKAIQTVLPTQFNDIVAILALFRPGPMDFIPEYARKKAGNQVVDYWDESLKPILEPTYGILIYQEQIIQLLQIMAGFSLGKADIVRRAISKKEETKLRSIESDFMAGSIAKGYSNELAIKVFKLIMKFADYGFNKAHSVAYAIIAVQMAWLKKYYPAPFYASVFNSFAQLSGDGKLTSYMNEIRALGIKILLPSINESSQDYVIENEQSIRYPFRAIKGISSQLVEEIVRERMAHSKFTGFFDFVARLGPNHLNDKQLLALIDVGAFDEFGQNRATLRQSINSAMMYQHVEAQNRHTQDHNIIIEREPPRFDKVAEDPLETLEREYQLLGLFLSGFPLTHRRDELTTKGYVTIDDACKHFTHQRDPKLLLYVSESRSLKTRKGDSMAIVTGMDETGILTVFVFSEVFQQVEHILKRGNYLHIEGTIEFRDEKYSMIARLIRLDQIKGE